MNKVKWIIFAAVVVAIFGGIIWLGKQDETTYSGDAKQIITEGLADHVYGTNDQKVTLIEYADYQCPACASIAETVHTLADKYKDKLTYIFRHLPLTSIHPNALAAATAAEAAGKQGKFYEMNDLLYQTQQSWSSASVADRGTLFQNYAQQLGLNIDQYKADLTSKDITDKINRDISTGRNQFKLDSTPSFLLNGEKTPEGSATNPEQLTKVVEDALKKAYGDSIIAP